MSNKIIFDFFNCFFKKDIKQAYLLRAKLSHLDENMFFNMFLKYILVHLELSYNPNLKESKHWKINYYIKKNIKNWSSAELCKLYLVVLGSYQENTVSFNEKMNKIIYTLVNV